MSREKVLRNIKRELPVVLDDREWFEVAKHKADLEAEQANEEAKLDEIKSEATTRIKDLEKRIDKLGAELRTGEQVRVVDCLQRYVRDGEHAGKVETVRKDTGQVVERHVADLLESRDALPKTEADAGDGILEEASKAQRDANVEETEDGDIVTPDSPAPKKRPSKRNKAKR